MKKRKVHKVNTRKMKLPAKYIELLLVLVNVSLLGLFIFNTRTSSPSGNVSTSYSNPTTRTEDASATPQANANFATYTDPTKTFSFSYPKDWQLQQVPVIEPVAGIPLYAQQSITFPLAAPQQDVKPTILSITAYKTEDAERIVGYYPDESPDPYVTSENVNSYPSKFVQAYQGMYDYYGSRVAGEADSTVAVTHNGITVVFRIRQFATSPYATYGQSDESKTFSTIAHSITFHN